MKKGNVFMGIFVVMVVVLLVFFALMMRKNEERRDQEYVEAIGYAPLALIKVYDEAEKVSLYLDQTAEYASIKAIEKLKKNGGYAEENVCDKTPNNIVIWSSCLSFDPGEEYKKQVEREIKFYTLNYQSTYVPFRENQALVNLRRDVGLLPQDIGHSLVEKYTQMVKNVKIKEINEDGQIIFEPLSFPIEYAPTDSTYTLEPESTIENHDLKVYDQLYNALFSCVGNQGSLDTECRSQLSNEFEDIEFIEVQNLVVVEVAGITFAVDPSQDLPPRAALRVVS